ncbi:MAG: 23S rRNA (pseudouridine(1915)-N(3))-methyltransferase RlmH [Lachnospiraceae bacterium]|jgi:23S rRNA (pseudouridine1915-N3)-methyltransferase|nr:23S rRNA (pseudouridine(1915)-N(3))-methyltransferase RlmH [Lachnospiraceae bacterium]
MKITLLTVGKIKEKYLRDAIDEYSKRLGKFCKLNIVEVKDEETKQSPSQSEIEEVKNKEGRRLMEYIDDKAYVCGLFINSKEYSSEEFAHIIDDLGVKGISHICFVIGGSLGISDEIEKRCNMKISFSPMTFPHQLMRVILLEQIYRAYKINNNEPYHK